MGGCPVAQCHMTMTMMIMIMIMIMVMMMIMIMIMMMIMIMVMIMMMIIGFAGRSFEFPPNPRCVVVRKVASAAR